MENKRLEDNRPTIDYTQYEEYPDEEYERRFSLHTVGANPMMGESMDFNYAEMNQEDNGQYFNRLSGIPGNNNYQMNNYVQNYQIKNEAINFQSLTNHKQGEVDVKSKFGF